MVERLPCIPYNRTLLPCGHNSNMKHRSLAAFRLGDVRGIYPKEIDERFARDFAHAFVREFGLAGKVVTGRDMRESSISLQGSLNQGFRECGLEVLDIGLCPTELGYFASANLDCCATIIVTASHNPARYNGFKCVLRKCEAVTFDSGLSAVMSLMQTRMRWIDIDEGGLTNIDLQDRYLKWLRDKFDPASLLGGKVALNGLNGTASTLAARIADDFGLPVTWFRKEPGPIPEEGADPIKPRLQAEMKQFMSTEKFNLGVAWDGDCDRCVFFDECGNLVPTYYIIGLLAERFLKKNPGRAIVFDTKLCWNTLDIIAQNDGEPVPSETGHAFMKRKMRAYDAIYGGELSSHHFFGEFFHCDSGIFAWLNVLHAINETGMEIGELVRERRKLITCTPEINLAIDNVDRAFAEVLDHYRTSAESVEHFDGLSMSMPGGWRFSLRRSKTEPLVRINFESRAGGDLLLQEGAKLIQVLAPFRKGNEAAELYIQ